MNQLQAIRNALLTALRIIDENSRVRKADGGTLTYIDPLTGLPREGMGTPKNFFALEPAESAGPNFAPPSQIANNYPGGAFEPDDFGPGQTQPGGGAGPAAGAGAGPAAASQPDFNKSLPGTESTNYGRIGGIAGLLGGPGLSAVGRAAGTAADVNAVNKSIKGYGFGEDLTAGQIASGVGNSMSFGLFGTPLGESATQNINAGVNAFEQDPANAGFMARTTAEDLEGPGGPDRFGPGGPDGPDGPEGRAAAEREGSNTSDGGAERDGTDTAERRGGRVYHKASGGSTMPMHDHAQAIRAALLTARGMADGGALEGGMANVPPHPLQATFEAENRPAAVISSKPGVGARPPINTKEIFGYNENKEPIYYNPDIYSDDPRTQGWSQATPNLIGAPVPPIVQAPTRAKPDIDTIHRASKKILESKGFQDIARDHIGVKNIKITPIVGTWKQEEEPSFVLHGEHVNGGEMTSEQAKKLAHMVGFGWAQDAAVQSFRNLNTEDGIPTLLIGHGNKLSKTEKRNILSSAAKEKLDLSFTVDGKAAKFNHYDGDETYPEFQDKVHRIADQAKMPERYHAKSKGDLNYAPEYLSQIFGGTGEEGGIPAGTPGSSDLLRRISRHVIAPYARAIGEQGFRYSHDRLADQFGLSDEHREIVRQELLPNNPLKRSTVPIMTGEETLPVKATGDRGQASVDDVLYALQNRAAKTGQIQPGDYSDKAKSAIASPMADEIAHHVLESGGKAIGWYDRALKAAKLQYSQVFPEINKDKDKGMLFDALLGITSQGNDVHSNSVYAARLYNLVRDGNMSVKEAAQKLSGTMGQQTRAIEQNLEKFDHLIGQNGYDKMRALFNKKTTVGELNDALRNDKSLYGPNGKPLKAQGASNQTVNGWSVFGPKIGSFINNLHGDYSTLTADLWFSRTWNRLLGQNFLHTPLQEAKQYQDFKDAMRAEYYHQNKYNEAIEPKRYDKDGKPVPWLHGKDTTGMSREEFDRIYDDPENLLKFAEETNKKYQDSGFKAKSDLRRRAKNWIQNRYDAVAAPRGDKEREFQQATVEQSKNILKKKYNMDISVADIQAALWYHEKELLGKFGATNERSEPADYEDAAKRTIDLYKSGNLYKPAEKQNKKPKKESRGGYIRPSLSSTTLDRALRLTSPERLAATRVR